MRKAIFDSIRAAKGAGLTQEQVDTISYALDRVGVPKDSIMQIGQKGLDLIEKWEGYAKDLGNGKVQSYPDPATGGAPWTIGIGTTGPDVVEGTVWTKEKAISRFHEHVSEFANGVCAALGGAPTTRNQFDAIVAWAYNVGLGAMRDSTLLKKHKAGDFSGAADEFLRWNKADGKIMQGLVNRRKEERALYLL